MSTIKIIGNPLYQWEIGRKVQIVPLSNMIVNEVHFSNHGDSEALVVKPTEENGVITATIPNILLQSGRPLVVHSVNVAEDLTDTLCLCVFDVRQRAKPSNYAYTEVDILNFSTLEKRLEAVEKCLNEEDEDSNIVDHNGKLKQDVLPDGYPYKEVVERREAIIENSTADCSTLHVSGAYENTVGAKSDYKTAIGDEVIIIVDGVEYRQTLTIASRIGNSWLYNHSLENTGEPWVIFRSGNMYKFFHETAGEHTWSLYKVVTEEVYHKMDENFMTMIDITVDGKTYKVCGYEVTQ